ncbi:WecB/TagA/CpsF family glycosyltransferase [Neptunicella marina]|uniref:WecB/TagA/CpsF family glycosyltransferase n=1 Tax=Neptunicella marina TaxID=2125989 RepID=A0A8J6M1A4_9ALTE|nr:WecB/TagA/CpsF family glycosyltransferase [Neptunicella marina]MBC3767649.1 WecB/TagA/CpsF family glycosyltransferase [Neptunicella marina]
MTLADIVFTQVGGLRTACVTRKQLVELITAHATRNHTSAASIDPMLIFSTNGHSISIANRDKTMGALLNQADLLHADGQSVVLFSRYFSEHPIPERSATTDMIHDVPQMSPLRLRHFLLGAKQSTVEKCADTLADMHSNFVIAGTHHGYFSQQQEDELIEKINQVRPDVLWVGLGKPKEQLFALRHKHHLKVPVVISCGGCFNFVTGEYKRAPQAMQEMGLEWLHRAVTEPRKLLWRYLTTNPHAVFCAVKHRHRQSLR